MSPNTIKILDDAYLVISATAAFGGDVFGLGDALGGTSDGALLMVRVP